MFLAVAAFPDAETPIQYSPNFLEKNCASSECTLDAPSSANA